MSNSRRRMLQCIFSFSVLSLVPFLYIEVTRPVRYLLKHTDVSSSCIIPNLDPFDPSVMQFMWKPQSLVCDSLEPTLVYVDNKGLLQFNASALQFHSVKRSDLRCEYAIIRRNSDDVTVSVDQPVSFTPPYSVTADYFRVICKTILGKNVFDTILTNIAKDSVSRTVSVEDDSPEQLSVILFGIDSVSRSASLRKLPNTVRYLKEELQSYEFKGFMKVKLKTNL